MDKIASKRYELLLSLAKHQDRKSLEKELNKARASFSSAKNDFDHSIQDFREAEKRLDEARARMTDARKTILELTKFIQTMDLTGAEAINQRGDSINYIMDGKEYYIDTSNLDNLHKIPWKEYKRLQIEKPNENDTDID